jgi:hypothetical protein
MPCQLGVVDSTLLAERVLEGALLAEVLDVDDAAAADSGGAVCWLALSLLVNTIRRVTPTAMTSTSAPMVIQSLVFLRAGGCGAAGVAAVELLLLVVLVWLVLLALVRLLGQLRPAVARVRHGGSLEWPVQHRGEDHRGVRQIGQYGVRARLSQLVFTELSCCDANRHRSVLQRGIDVVRGVADDHDGLGGESRCVLGRGQFDGMGHQVRPVR